MERDQFMYKVLKAIQNGKKPHQNDFSMNEGQFEAEIDHIKKSDLVQIDATNNGSKGPELTAEGMKYIKEYEQE